MTNWSPADIPDLAGRTALVTGASSGIGHHTALHLAAHGAHVLLGSRNPERGDRAVTKIRTEAPGAKVDLVLLDLANLDGVRETAAKVLAEHEGIDLLVNNAGEKLVPRRRLTEDGFEAQFGTNHLGHFALTGLLLPALLRRPGARVVSVTSIAHRFFGMDFEDPQNERDYRGNRAYSQSKLANLLFTLELHRRVGERGLISVASHPGFATDTLGNAVLDFLSTPLIQKMAQGALPSLYAATAGGVVGGQLFGPGNLVRTKGSPRLEQPSAKARDEATARGLWELSEKLTGVTYDLRAT
jgi:NAD(P)-dependent dehydrogenase (short-subunit alcohol dehydrogenase family)